MKWLGDDSRTRFMIGPAATSSPASATGCARAKTTPAACERSSFGTRASAERASSILPASAQHPAAYPAPSHPDGPGLRAMNWATSTGLQKGFADANQRWALDPPGDVAAACTAVEAGARFEANESAVTAKPAAANTAKRGRTCRRAGGC